MLLDSPLPFHEALDYIAKKHLLPTDMSSIELSQLSTSIRERSLFSAKTLLDGYLGEIKDKVTRILNPETAFGGYGNVTVGRDFATSRLELKQALAGLDYSPEPGKEGTIQDLSSDNRINLVLKTNVEMAQGYGSWRQGQDETVLDQWPAQELFRAESREVPRDWLSRWQGAGGRLYDGRMIALKNDSIWTEISAFDQPYPPFDFNSGMDVRDVSRDDAVQMGLIDEDTQIQPQRRSFEMAA